VDWSQLGPPPGVEEPAEDQTLSAESHPLTGAGFSARRGGDLDARSTRAETAAPPRRRDQSLWIWPVVALAVIALAGQLRDATAALLSAVVLVATLVLFIGDTLHLWFRLAVLGVSIVLVATLVTSQVSGFDRLFRPHVGDDGRMDLRGQQISADQVSNLDFQRARLSGAVLDNLSLVSKDFTKVIANGTSFRGADLTNTTWLGADLRGADFRGACLVEADFTGARLDGIDATGADTSGVILPPQAMTNSLWPAVVPSASVPACD